jgi:hypothetical protein
MLRTRPKKLLILGRGYRSHLLSGIVMGGRVGVQAAQRAPGRLEFVADTYDMRGAVKQRISPWAF